MPVKKTMKRTPRVTTTKRGLNACHNCNFGKMILALLVGVLLLYLILWLAALTRNTYKEYSYIGLAQRSERSIAVEAQGKVTAIPDIAMTSIGMISEGVTVEEAQISNTKVMNDLISRLKQMEISEEDIQTANYNIYPIYLYKEDGGRELSGYEVSQRVDVKIRQLDKATNVLALAGAVGANSVSGLSFTIDDPEVYKEAARQDAIAQVYKKAADLSKRLGVKIIGVVSYNEYSPTQSYTYKTMAMDSVGGYGLAPEVEEGSTDIIVNVNVTFEIER